MAMASHFRFPLTQLFILLLSYVAAIVAVDIAHPELSAKISQRSPSYDPQPQDFPSKQLYSNYLVIQRFKKTITSDPKNITATWRGNDICSKKSYLGFYCASLPGTTKLAVTVVIFNGYGLRAPKLKGFIDQLPDLALLHSASNSFGGDIPYLAGLDYNYKLNIGNNIQIQDGPDLVGTRLVTGVHGCVNFDIDINFHLRRPKFGKQKGQNIPGDTDSKALLLNYNNISGPFPANIGFSKLSYLALANNKLTGPIPQSIAHLQDSLVELLLLNNQLSGCLPHELGMLTKTTVIDAGKNQLTGPIPSSFSCLASVEQLNLGENRLYGQVPDALCKLGRLANLTLSGNYFSSVGPACAALVKDGVLDVKRNCVPGLANQRAPAECASFMSQPKASCPAASAPVSCPAAAAADAKTKMAPEGTRAAAKDYASYVTYATLHE